MKRLGVFILSTMLFAQTPNLGSQETPNTGTILQIEGEKDTAIQALKSQGIKAVELTGTPFLLPSVQIEGAEQIVEYGEMIHLKAIVDRARLPEHLSTLKYQWTVFEDGKPKRNFVVWPDGTQIFFAAGMKPKKITVVLDVDCLFEVKQSLKVLDPSGKPLEGVKVVSSDGKPVSEVVVESEINSPELIVAEIQIGSGPPPVPPGPGPVPPPGPGPTPPPGPTPTPDLNSELGLARVVYDLANANVSAGDRVKAGDLAKSYTGVADRIRGSLSKQAAGVALTDEDLALNKEAIMKAIVASNRTALGASSNAWQQWDKLYGDEVYRLATTRKVNLNQAADWEKMFRETALGLSAVR